MPGNELDIKTIETWLWDAACKIMGVDAHKGTTMHFTFTALYESYYYSNSRSVIHHTPLITLI
ncbi:MAG: hypothetical protein U9Q68_02085 [Euryarchaeota archaeon]|nr:hypothetical protein [Euryarchaeota archaeon]